MFRIVIAPLEGGSDKGGERDAVLTALLGERGVSLEHECRAILCGKRGSGSPLYLSVAASLIALHEEGARGSGKALAMRVGADLQGTHGICSFVFQAIESMLGVFIAQEAALDMMKQGGCQADELHDILTRGGDGGRRLSRAEEMLESLMPNECRVDWSARRQLRRPFLEDATMLYVCDGMERSDLLITLSRTQVEVHEQRAKEAWYGLPPLESFLCIQLTKFHRLCLPIVAPCCR